MATALLKHICTDGDCWMAADDYFQSTYVRNVDKNRQKIQKQRSISLSR